MRKCLYGWVYGNYNFKTKFSARDINLISEMLLRCNNRKPTEIHRAIRPLKCLKFWKGSEYRTFLLYLGPVVLKDFLSPPVYHNYLLLFCGVTILSCSTYLKYIEIADILLRDFIMTFGSIYGSDAISSNVHNLCHVVNDVKKFGCLVDISAYPFENFLFQIKSLVRTGKHPLAQIAKRVVELENLNINNFRTKQKSLSPFVAYENNNKIHELPECSKVYNNLSFSNYILSNNIKNKWFLSIRNDIVEMINATYYKGKIHIYGSSLNNKKDFFVLPIKSSYINIYQCHHKNKSNFNKPALYPLSDIKCKLFAIEYKDSIVFFPLLHTLDTSNNNS